MKTMQKPQPRRQLTKQESSKIHIYEDTTATMVKKNLSLEKAGKTPSSMILNQSTDSKIKVMETIMSTEERQERFDGYQITGDFEKDVTELATILGLPITVSPRVKVAAPHETGSVTGKHKDDKKSSISSSLSSEEEKSVDGEFIPSTFVLSTCKDYFSPKVLIDPDTETKGCVKEIYLRGWLADSRVMDIFAKTFVPTIEKISVLDLSNAGLTDETLPRLYDCIKSSPSVKSLNLNGNKFAKNQRFDLFLSQDDKLSLQDISLRYCDINEVGALHLGMALADNTSLQTLNLSNNKLCNNGAWNIAEGLKINRTLVALNLSSNMIGDVGVEHIIAPLTTFPLTHQQVIILRFYFYF